MLPLPSEDRLMLSVDGPLPSRTVLCCLLPQRTVLCCLKRRPFALRGPSLLPEDLGEGNTFAQFCPGPSQRDDGPLPSRTGLCCLNAVLRPREHHNLVLKGERPSSGNIRWSWMAKDRRLEHEAYQSPIDHYIASWSISEHHGTYQSLMDHYRISWCISEPH